MTLGQLIKRLQTSDPDAVLRWGFGAPHSYRGDYAQLAFELVGNVKVSDMLAHAEGALGETFQGYKGGEYKMDEWVDVYIAEYGHCGEQLGPLLLNYMLEDTTRGGEAAS